MKKHSHQHPPARTHFLWWCAAVICSILSLAVIVAGIVVFVGYLVLHPRIPTVSVVGAHLNRFQYDMAGVLVTQVSIDVRSENDNSRAHASFAGMNLTLIFDGVEIARLMAGPYEVRKNDSVVFNYLATSEPIPLDNQQQRDVDISINEDLVKFTLRGNSRARWRIGVLGSVHYQIRLDCVLRFRRSDGAYIPSRCTSKAK